MKKEGKKLQKHTIWLIAILLQISDESQWKNIYFTNTKTHHELLNFQAGNTEERY